MHITRNPSRSAMRSEATAALFLQCLQGNEQRYSELDAAGRAARGLRRFFALALIVLLVPLTTGSLLGQSYPPPSQQAPPLQYDMDSGPGEPPPPPPDGLQGEGPGQSQGQPEGQPMSPEELGQMVAPIALYPDALVAQILAASTYPSQVVEADRWVQAQGDLPAAQLAAAANNQSWDPSVKALVAFPSVLAQMDKNIQWTTDLGNAYYNQPDDVMAAIQTMRSRAQAAGNLQSTPQQQVSNDDGDIVIAPEDPDVVYVPTYDPWAVYGEPVVVFPGYYYGPPAGVYFGSGLAIGFGIGIGIGVFSNWGWGYHHWGFNWRDRAVLYNRGRYHTRSRTVYNRGWNRPGGSRGRVGTRGAYNRGGNFNRGGHVDRGGNFNRGGSFNRGGNSNRGAEGFNYGASRGNRGIQNNNQNRNFNRGTQNIDRGIGNNNRGMQNDNRTQNFNRGMQNDNRTQNFNRGMQNDNRSQNFNRGVQNGNRSQNFNRSVQNDNRTQNFNRGMQNDNRSQNFNRVEQHSNRGGQEGRSAARFSGGGYSGGSHGGSRGGGGGHGGSGHGGGHGR